MVVPDMGDTDVFECRRAQYADVGTSWTRRDVTWSVGDAECIASPPIAVSGPVGQARTHLIGVTHDKSH